MAARYWLGTLFDWLPPEDLPDSCCWLKGQQETCPTTLRNHYQVIAGFIRAVRVPHIKRVIGNGHWEATRSKAADDYVHKDLTAVEGTRFELGSKAFRRNEPTDWDRVRALAITGDYGEIPSDVFVRYYQVLINNLVHRSNYF